MTKQLISILLATTLFACSTDSDEDGGDLNISYPANTPTLKQISGIYKLPVDDGKTYMEYHENGDTSWYIYSENRSCYDIRSRVFYYNIEDLGEGQFHAVGSSYEDWMQMSLPDAKTLIVKYEKHVTDDGVSIIYETQDAIRTAELTWTENDVSSVFNFEYVADEWSLVSYQSPIDIDLGWLSMGGYGRGLLYDNGAMPTLERYNGKMDDFKPVCQ